MAKTADNQELVERLTGLLTPVVRSEGLILVELQFRPEGLGLVLRLFVERPEGGVSLDDCAQVSRQASDLLDVEDIVPGRFSLEVSSPGLTRRLKTARDFTIFAGRLVKMMVRDADGKNRTYRGQLKGMQGEEVVLEVEGRLRTVPLGDVLKANLDISF
jgi:ribosome maturation factor RimP